MLCYRLTHLCVLYMSKYFGMANTKFIGREIYCLPFGAASLSRRRECSLPPLQVTQISLFENSFHDILTTNSSFSRSDWMVRTGLSEFQSRYGMYCPFTSMWACIRSLFYIASHEIIYNAVAMVWITYGIDSTTNKICIANSLFQPIIWKTVVQQTSEKPCILNIQGNRQCTL